MFSSVLDTAAWARWSRWGEAALTQAALSATYALLVAATVGGCKQAPVIDLRLVLLGDLALGDSARVVIVDADDGHVVLDSGQQPATAISSGDLFDAGSLSEGDRLLVQLVAKPREGDCTLGSGRLIGRSLPFEHTEGGYVVHIPVGCGDEFNATGSMANHRVQHSAALTDDGAVIISGGSQEVVMRPDSPTAPVAVTRAPRTIERYDMRTATFEELSLARDPSRRLLASSVALPDGSVVAIGGLIASNSVATSMEPGEEFGCHATYERVWPPERAMDGISMLHSERCLPSAVALEGAVVIAGGAMTMSAAHRIVEAHDPSMTDAEDPRLEPDPGAESMPLDTDLVATLHGALLVGAPPTPDNPATVRAVRADATTVSLSPLDATMSMFPPPGWQAYAVAVADCDDAASDVRQTVYITGGVAGLGAMPADVAWCIPVTRTGYGDVRAFPGAMGGPRANHETIVVSGPDGPRLLLVPGIQRLDGELMGIDGCDCVAPGTRDGMPERTSIPMPAPPGLTGNLTYQDGTATRLADGTVLLTGIAFQSEELADLDPMDPMNPLERVNRSVGNREAFLFVPDDFEVPLR